MKLTRLVAVAVILGGLSVVGAMAQTTKPGAQPAEFPPLSYKGQQYVDSAGCVFIRAGIGDTVSWIPRMTRNRTGVCGFKPSLSGQAANSAPAATGAKTPLRITKVTTKTPKARPVVRQTAPVRKVSPPQQGMRSSASAFVFATPAGPEMTRQPGCRGGNAVSDRYINSSGKYPVRCGPQGAEIAGRSVRNVTGHVAKAPMPVTVSPTTRIVPKHVAIRRQNTTNVSVPRGYRKVWKDDRLNPHRAEQNLAGHRQMQQIWTSTVPRRLINQANGRDLTAPEVVVYANTGFAKQPRARGQAGILPREVSTQKRSHRQPFYSSRSSQKHAETLYGNR